MIQLYSPARAVRMGRRARISLTAACALLLLALTACIALCARVNTRNAERMLLIVIGLFTLAGWAAILLLTLVYRPSAAGCRHMQSILSDEAEEMAGKLVLTSALFQIPKGILVRRAALEDGDEKHTLNIYAHLAKQLPPSGTRVRVRVVRKFISAFEVLP